MRKLLSLIFLLFFSWTLAAAQDVTEGSLFAAGRNGETLGICPLKNTKVRANVSGFVARVNVVQEFENSYAETIEAVYMFPLSNKGAVDSMTMTIGSRTIKGAIMTREAARKTYDAAKSNGQTAALLDQERPNIFTQSVANILPGEKIVVEISYVETLKFEDGAFEFVFPMTVAERYIPASMPAKNAAKITPTFSTTRAGHTISIGVSIDAGVPLNTVESPTHLIDSASFSASSSRIVLRDSETIPNKDFVLRFDVTGAKTNDAILTHRDGRDGFFTFVLTPPDAPRTEDITPKEIVFVLDSSGSMDGFPIEKAKEAIRLSLDGLYPHDTFNLITFAGSTSVLFQNPVPATQENINSARSFLQNEGAGGGTEMMTAIRAALEPTDSQEHLRIVCFMTDGLVGNENEIIAEVQKHPKARVFSFGIGSSVNRELLDKVAQEGRGEATYVTKEEGSEKAARQFYERVRSPMLTDVTVDFNGLPVADVYPKKPGDFFGAKPLVMHGRYTAGVRGKITLRGKLAGLDYSRDIDVELPEKQTENASLASLWARSRVDELTTLGLADVMPAKKAATRKSVTEIALKYGLMTEFTSFVAVDETIRSFPGNTKKVEVPSAREKDTPFRRLEIVSKLQRPPQIQYGSSSATVIGSRQSVLRSGVGSGSGRGSADAADAELEPPAVKPTPNAPQKVVSLGVINGRAEYFVEPSYPAAARAVRVSGLVNVQITIDEKGNVVNARAVSGHPLLRAAAIDAARKSKFVPTLLSGTPVSVSGVIVYNFVGDGNWGQGEFAVNQVETQETLTPEMRADFERLQKIYADDLTLRRKLLTKLHFRVFTLLGDEPKLDERFVSNGVARLEITLAPRTPDTVEVVRAAGFEIDGYSGKASITGRVTLDKIAKLAALDEVRLIIPLF